MRGEQRGAHADVELAADLARDAQLLRLRRRVETVAGLDLDGGHAFGGQRRQPRQALRGEARFAGRTRVAHRRGDAAAGARDVGIGGTLLPLFEFEGAVARVDEMRVAIDEPRRHPGTRAGDGLLGDRVARQRGARPAPGNRFAENADGAIANGAVVRTAALHRGEMRVHQQNVEMRGGHDAAARRASVAR